MDLGIGQIREVRRNAEAVRGGLRSDVARELSLAITHLEDAEMRLTRALIRQSRHQADAAAAIEKIEDALLAEEDTAPEPDEAGAAPDSERKEVG